MRKSILYLFQYGVNKNGNFMFSIKVHCEMKLHQYHCEPIIYYILPVDPQEYYIDTQDISHVAPLLACGGKNTH